jgi:hypothetical protein
MGPPSYKRSVVDPNIVMGRMTVTQPPLHGRHVGTSRAIKTFYTAAHYRSPAVRMLQRDPIVLLGDVGDSPMLEVRAPAVFLIA